MSKQESNCLKYSLLMLAILNEEERAKVVEVLHDEYKLSYNDGELYTKEELR